jgi:hypothetical protein
LACFAVWSQLCTNEWCILLFFVPSLPHISQNPHLLWIQVLCLIPFLACSNHSQKPCLFCCLDSSTAQMSVLIQALHKWMFWSKHFTNECFDSSTSQMNVLIQAFHKWMFWSMHFTNEWMNEWMNWASRRMNEISQAWKKKDWVIHCRPRMEDENEVIHSIDQSVLTLRVLR